MIKYLLLAVLLLSGCDAYNQDVTRKYIMPQGLNDCKVYSVRADGGGYITVVRCPNSSTTSRFGKGGNATVTE